MRKRFILVALLPLLAFMVGCATDKAVISQADQLHSGLKPAVMNDPQLDAYLQGIGDRILAVAAELDRQHVGPESHTKEESGWMFTKNMKFHLVNSKTLNAFTTGGDHMYIYNELLQQARTEDELAAVMAHEYAHVYCRHVQKGMDRSMAMMAGAAGAGAVGYAAGGEQHGSDYASIAAGAAAAAGQFIGMGFTRKDEAQADEYGFMFYTRAGWDPNRFGDFFQHMIDMGYDTTPELASDHPTLKSRVDKAKEYAKALPPEAASWRKPPVASPTEFAALKARAAELGKTMPTDKSTEQAQQLLAAFPSCVAPTETKEQKTAQVEVKKRAAQAQAQGGQKQKKDNK